MTKRRKQARAAAHALRQQPGWDPGTAPTESPLERLRELEQAERTESTLVAADLCEQCQALRKALGDETALCEEHMRQVMGM